MLINLRALKSVAHFVSTEETRYYLNGVHVENDNGALIMVATDGHILGAVRQSNAEAACLTAPVIIPSALVNQIKINKHVEDGEIVVDGDTITISYCGASFSMGRVDGCFPDWRRVLPHEKPSGEPAQYNPALLTRIAKAATVWGGSKNPTPAISYNGGSPALVNCFSDESTPLFCTGFGVVMPMRNTDTIDRTPGWALPTKAENAKAA
jgi:DNA polymerase-3 subunit beta